jgi:predicted cobalt transporter CbtA
MMWAWLVTVTGLVLVMAGLGGSLAADSPRYRRWWLLGCAAVAVALSGAARRHQLPAADLLAWVIMVVPLTSWWPRPISAEPMPESHARGESAVAESPQT